MGIRDRGIIAPGAHADLVLFDPAAVRDLATMDDINRISTGIVKTWVNGQVVYADGKATGARPGRVVRRTEAPARAPQTPGGNANGEEH
jgi:N-acyl-D-amino-acid deacylase